MHSGERLTSGFAATLLVLLFSLSLRALMPVGYMPAVGDGSFHLVICSATAPARADGGSDHERPADPAPACAFAGVAAITGPADPPLLPRPVILPVVREAGFSLRDPPVADRSEGPPPPARAPPLSI